MGVCLFDIQPSCFESSICSSIQVHDSQAPSISSFSLCLSSSACCCCCLIDWCMGAWVHGCMDAWIDWLVFSLQALIQESAPRFKSMIPRLLRAHSSTLSDDEPMDFSMKQETMRRVPVVATSRKVSIPFSFCSEYALVFFLLLFIIIINITALHCALWLTWCDIPVLSFILSVDEQTQTQQQNTHRGPTSSALLTLIMVIAWSITLLNLLQPVTVIRSSQHHHSNNKVIANFDNTWFPCCILILCRFVFAFPWHFLWYFGLLLCLLIICLIVLFISLSSDHIIIIIIIINNNNIRRFGRCIVLIRIRRWIMSYQSSVQCQAPSCAHNQSQLDRRGEPRRETHAGWKTGRRGIWSGEPFFLGCKGVGKRNVKEWWWRWGGESRGDAHSGWTPGRRRIWAGGGFSLCTSFLSSYSPHRTISPLLWFSSSPFSSFVASCSIVIIFLFCLLYLLCLLLICCCHVCV